MVYVDLNPILAGISYTPENSDYTRVKQRIDALKKKKTIETAPKVTAKPKDIEDTEASQQTNVKLMSLVKHKNDRHPNAIGYTF